MSNPQTNLKCSCRECPFNRNGPRGYIGPYKSVNELHAAVTQESPFPCHLTVDHDGQQLDETELCPGSMIYANGACKLFRDPWMREQQERIRALNTDNNVTTYADLLEHHK